MNYKNTVTYLLLITYALVILYLSGIQGVLSFLLSLCIYTLVFYGLHILWKKFRKKQIMYINDFINYFLNRVAILLVIIIVVIGGGAYILNEIFPAPMPEYTISDGNKVIKFQAMSHIGTTNFYNQIVENLTNFKKEGGVYYYEGVKPGSPENLDKFNKAIGIKFDDDLYKNFSKLYGLTNQDNSIFMGIINNNDYNIDLNMDEIITEYSKIIEQKPKGEKEFQSKLPIDANNTIIKTLAGLNDKELKVLIYINQALLNLIIGNEKLQGFLTNTFTNRDLFEVILGKRNEVLANEIINSNHDKIYITYGLLHFKGVYELLKEDNNKWQIISISNLYPIKN
ncbi:MAG: hypothetical protein Q8K30_00660 [Candidatus Gracilibacteria bacterium]|nr:hypothetical protein [Candidatus Gracilibacteria bacterium]